MTNWICAFLLLCLACCATNRNDSPQLLSINIIDRNGLTETVGAKDRLRQFDNVDFRSPQPYQKVLRIYDRDSEGNVRAVITSYHPNGLLKQYLEVLNNRAYGVYQEWYPNGCKRIQANVIGGTADIALGSEKTWLFDGVNFVWNENGDLEAEIRYAQGALEGQSVYFHKNGKIWKKENFKTNSLDGIAEVYLDSGELLQTSTYSCGVKNGPSFRYWGECEIASKEYYQTGLLMEGVYYDRTADIIAEITGGEGTRAIYGKNTVTELHEYHKGAQDGEVRLFDRQSNLSRLYHVKNGIKNGEEIEYYEDVFPNPNPIPKLSIMWSKGKIQGSVKTWYPNGKLESQREMSENKKNGVLSAWYKDGNLMMIEEYDHDKMVKGEYYRKGDKTPVSQIVNGKGTASLFDADGNPTRKVTYQYGKPSD